VVKDILAWLSAPVGAAFIGALVYTIKKLGDAANVRAEAKKISADGHAETQRLLTAELAEQRKLAQEAIAEAAAARTERDAAISARDAADKKATRLSAQVELLKNQNK